MLNRYLIYEIACYVEIVFDVCLLLLFLVVLLVENLCLKMGKYKGLSDLSGRNCYLVAENLSALICLSSLSQIAKETLSLQIL